MSAFVLITGATSGIGLETARVFLRQGNNVFITGLKEAEVIQTLYLLKNEFPHSIIDGISIDLSVNGSAGQLYHFTNQKGMEVDLLVNNAGFGSYGNVVDTDVEREWSMINLMVSNMYMLTRYYLKDMVNRNRGTIVNISSVSAFQPNPTLAAYGACKAFVYQFSRALNEELKALNSRVRCITICPTPVRTSFQQTAGMEKSSLFDSWMTVEAPFVAKEIYNAVSAGKDYIIPGKLFHWVSKISRRLPERILIKIARQHLKPVN